MGKRKTGSKQTARLQHRDIDAPEAGALRTKQRRLEREARSALLLFGLAAILFLLVASLQFKSTSPVLSSPRSDVYQGGLPDDTQLAKQLLANNPNPVFRDFQIDIANTYLSRVELDREDDQLYVVSRYQSGLQPETILELENETFYARPITNSLRSNSDSIAFEGYSQSGQWFAILKNSGNVVYRPDSQPTLSAKVFRQNSVTEAGDTARFFAQIKNISRDPVGRLDVTVSLSDASHVVSVESSHFSLESNLPASETVLANEFGLGGNNETWLTFVVRTNQQLAAGDTVCPNVQVISNTASDLFSDTQCVSMQNVVENTCLPQENGSYWLVGELAETDCSDTFANAIYRTTNLERVDDEIVLSADFVNFTGTRSAAISIVDILEYADLRSVKNAELNPNTQVLELGNNDGVNRLEALFDLKAERSSPTPATDPFSNDGIVSATNAYASANLAIEVGVVKNIEQLVQRLTIIHPVWSVVIVFIIVLLSFARFVQIPQELHRVVHSRKAAVGINTEFNVVKLPKSVESVFAQPLITSATHLASRTVLKYVPMSFALASAIVGLSFASQAAEFGGYNLSGSELIILLSGGWLFGYAVERAAKQLSRVMDRSIIND